MSVEQRLQTRDGDLLPGERPDSCYVDDAAHWAAVYAELTAVFVSHPHLKTFRATLDRYERRLGYWRRRLQELNRQPVAGVER